MFCHTAKVMMRERTEAPLRKKGLCVKASVKAPGWWCLHSQKPWVILQLSKLP